MVLASWLAIVPAAGSPIERDGDVDLDLLALLHDEEVDVLDDLVHGVLLHVLDERELGRAGDVELEQRVGAADEQRDLVARERDVLRVGAVAVDDGGDLAGGAEAAGGALAEVLAQLGVDLGCLSDMGVLLLGGGDSRRTVVCGFSTRTQTREETGGPLHRVDNGCRSTRGRVRIPRRGSVRQSTRRPRPPTTRLRRAAATRYRELRLIDPRRTIDHRQRPSSRTCWSGPSASIAALGTGAHGRRLLVDGPVGATARTDTRVGLSQRRHTVGPFPADGV